MYKFWHKVCKTYKCIQYVASICYFQSFCKLPLHPKQSHALSCSPCGTCGKDDLSAMLIAQCSSSFPRVALATLEPRFSSWNLPGNFQQIHGICIASIIESGVINFKISIYITVSDVFLWKSLSCPPIIRYSHVQLNKHFWTISILCFPHETWKICCQMFWWGASLNTVCISVCWQMWRARWNVQRFSKQSSKMRIYFDWEPPHGATIESLASGSAGSSSTSSEGSGLCDTFQKKPSANI